MPGNNGYGDGITNSPSSKQDNGSDYESALKGTIKTVEQMRLESEEKINNLAKTMAEEFKNSQIDWQKEIQGLSVRDAKELNRVKEELSNNLLAQQRKGQISQQEFEKKLQDQLYNYKLQLDANAEVEARRREIEFSKTRIQIERDRINRVAAMDKEDRVSKYKAELENLEELRKKRIAAIAAGEDTSKVDQDIKQAETTTKEAKNDIMKAEVNKREPSALRVGIKQLTSTFKGLKGMKLGDALKSLGKSLGNTVKSAGKKINGATGMGDVAGVLFGKTSREAIKERAEAGDKQAAAAEANLAALEDKMNSFVNGIAQLLQSYIDDYSNYQAKVNARLQGSGQT